MLRKDKQKIQIWLIGFPIALVFSFVWLPLGILIWAFCIIRSFQVDKGTYDMEYGELPPPTKDSD